MHLVGIDLAWGGRNPTGLAVLDDHGRLVHLASVRTDAQIEAELGPFVAADCVVAIDAPLIVRNPTGNRAAEAALNRDFGRFQAGTYPSNTGRALFHPTTRGERVARRLGVPISLDPGQRRRAIEVYPHAATISLFRLGRTLKYKHKPGRSLQSLRGELTRLMRLIEALAGAQPPMRLREAGTPWAELSRRVDEALRKSELRLVEDQVDAVLCAYVALLAARCPDRLTTYGDDEHGSILTPTLPPDLEPDPTPCPFPCDVGCRPRAAS